jgi:ubiquinone/menaquinone biosynthesis C-methylase UbiE
MSEKTYDIIGKGYNNTRQADPFLVSRLLHLLNPKTDKLYLDIGCGTGNYTIALADKGLRFYGVEPSKQMLHEAQSRKKNINWLLGTAEQIPTNNNTFDGAIATLTIHHWANIKKAFKEINRVLRDNGKIILFTSTPEQMKGYWLNHYFPKMCASSIIQMPSLDIIKKAATSAGLEITTTEKYFIKDDLQDHFLYVGKNNPELYFKEEVRKGISSFSLLANLNEVTHGLIKLRSDISSGAFNKIKNKYTKDLGDYLFIKAEKRQHL